MSIPNSETFRAAVLKLLPKATIEEDNEGQLVIYTNLTVSAENGDLTDLDAGSPNSHIRDCFAPVTHWTYEMLEQFWLNYYDGGRSSFCIDLYPGDSYDSPDGVVRITDPEGEVIAVHYSDLFIGGTTGDWSVRLPSGWLGVERV